MSHFTLQLDPRGGPILKVALGVSEARATALTAAGQKIPLPAVILGLVDTGASCTCVDPLTLQALGLAPTGQADCFTPSTGATPTPKNLYDVGLRIYSGDASEPSLTFPTIAVMESELFAAQGIHALIGRDVLARCILIYNGGTKQFTLAF